MDPIDPAVNKAIIDALLSEKGQVFLNTLPRINNQIQSYTPGPRESNNFEDRRHQLPPIELPYVNRNIYHPFNYFRAPYVNK